MNGQAASGLSTQWQFYLSQLDRALARWVSSRERRDIINWYTEYFEDAGPAREQEILRQLGDPEDLARQLAEERGYPTKPAGPTRKQICIAALLVVLLSLPIYALFHQSMYPNYSSAGSFVDVVEVAAERAEADPQMAEAYWYTEGRVEVNIPFGDIVLDRGEVLSVSATLNGHPADIHYTIDGKYLQVDGYSGIDREPSSGQPVIHVTVPSSWTAPDVFAITYQGNITVMDFAAYNLDVNAVTGDILVQGIQVENSLNLYTTTGDIHAANCSAALMNASANPGDIIVTGETPEVMDLSTDTGDIYLEMIGGLNQVSYEVWANTGSISVDNVQLGNNLSQTVEDSRQYLEAITDVGDVKIFTYDTGIENTL